MLLMQWVLGLEHARLPPIGTRHPEPELHPPKAHHVKMELALTFGMDQRTWLVSGPALKITTPVAYRRTNTYIFHTPLSPGNCGLSKG